MTSPDTRLHTLFLVHGGFPSCSPTPTLTRALMHLYAHAHFVHPLVFLLPKPDSGIFMSGGMMDHFICREKIYIAYTGLLNLSTRGIILSWVGKLTCAL